MSFLPKHSSLELKSLAEQSRRNHNRHTYFARLEQSEVNVNLEKTSLILVSKFAADATSG